MYRHTRNTVVTLGADLVGVSKSNTVSHLDGGDKGTNSLHNTNALMTENHISLQIMLIGATETGMSGLDKHFIMIKGSSASAGDDLALRRAAESVVCNSAHLVWFWYN